MIFDDYISYLTQFQNKYGNNTIVLMQVGGFFEFYGIDNSTTKLGDIYRFADIANINVTLKDKSKIENDHSNPLMSGFPIEAIDKFVNIYLKHNFTVVLVEQEWLKPDDPKPIRKVTKIYSPGIDLDHASTGESNQFMAIYIEQITNVQKNNKMCIGITMIDVCTGENSVMERYSSIDDYNKGLDEVFRYIRTHNPKEIVIYTENMQGQKESIVKYLELNPYVYHFYENTPKTYQKISYQEKVFSKYFKKGNMLSYAEYLDLEKTPFGKISYIVMLQFIYEHNENLLCSLQKPKLSDESDVLLLANSCVNQLHVIPDKNMENMGVHNSLFGIICKTSTSIGKRELRRQLLHPTTNIAIIEERYNQIDCMLKREDHVVDQITMFVKKGVYRYLDYEKKLRKIVDIERMHRKMAIGLLNPCDFVSLDLSYQMILECIDMTKQDHLDILPNKSILDKFNCFIESYRKTFEMEEMAKYTLIGIKNSFFKKGVNKDIDDIQKNIVEANLFFDTLISKLSAMIDPHKQNLVKLENTEKDGYTLYLTNNRAKLLKKAFGEKPTFEYQIDDKTYEFNYDSLDMKHLKQGTKLNSLDIQHYSDTLMGLRDKMKRVSQIIYLDFLKKYHEEYGCILSEIVRFVAKLDVIHSNAKCAVEYSYTRPILEKNNPTGCIDCKGLRHPIIERIHTKETYVPNDIILGKNLHGMLLFGVNAVGKSSLMKSVGLATIMAQAGMYVPCESMKYSPYRNLFTRISGNDNIFKGQSTFAVEMSELRSILKRSDDKSLILGDELCSGTESVSALAIVASGVISLAKKNASFIFATHLHALSEMERLRQLSNVNCFHLKVQYCAKSQTLMYDRKLEKGSGNPIYGLEVCKAMDLDEQFIELANEIRLETMGKSPEIIKTEPSHFNKDIYIDTCQNCGKTGIDVHHIKEQNKADIDGKIGHIHKNNESNLVVLCKDCHHEVHHGDLEIEGYKQTTTGIQLVSSNITNNDLSSKKGKKKFNEDHILTIMKYKEYPNKKDVVSMLLTNHNIKIGYGTLLKILKGTY